MRQMSPNPLNVKPYDYLAQSTGNQAWSWLADPSAALETLASRRQAPAQTTTTTPSTKGPAGTPKPATAAAAASPATSPVPLTSAAPAAVPAATTSTRWNQARDAARLMYESELQNLSARAQRGEQIDPLEYSRARDRFNNELGRIDATERNRGLTSANKTRRAESRAAKNKMAGEALSGLQSRLPGILSEGQSLVDAARPENQAPTPIFASTVSSPYRSEPTAPAPEPAGPAPAQIDMVQAAINLLRQASATSTPSQLSNLVTPTPAPAPLPHRLQPRSRRRIFGPCCPQ